MSSTASPASLTVARISSRTCGTCSSITMNTSANTAMTCRRYVTGPGHTERENSRSQSRELFAEVGDLLRRGCGFTSVAGRGDTIEDVTLENMASATASLIQQCG